MFPLSKRPYTVISPLIVETKKPIEDLDNYSFIDFANCCIGGGSLFSAAVQEEILFAIFPEACISMGVCNEMNDDEAISIKALRENERSIEEDYTRHLEEWKKDNEF